MLNIYSIQLIYSCFEQHMFLAVHSEIHMDNRCANLQLNEWNNLRSKVVKSTFVNRFKNLIDKHITKKCGLTTSRQLHWDVYECYTIKTQTNYYLNGQKDQPMMYSCIILFIMNNCDMISVTSVEKLLKHDMLLSFFDQWESIISSHLLPKTTLSSLLFAIGYLTNY